jgi:pimeloyl-ACP methyl ester carboxylesterase
MGTPRTRTVLFIQGGGEGTHDEWDDKLVDSLRVVLGEGFEVRYPRLPGEEDPSLASWGPAIRQEIAALDDDAVVIGHSVGGTILVHVIADEPPGVRPAAILLLASPFVGDGGWPGDRLELPIDLGARLPPDVPVHLFFGLEDDIVPSVHADLYARAIPQARVHRLPGRDHQLGNDLRAVASLIRALRPSTPTVDDAPTGS